MPKNQEIVQAKYEALQQEVLALTNLLQSANAQAMSDQSRLKKEAQTLKLALYQAVLESPKYPAEDVSDPVCGLLDKYEHQIDQLFLSATDCSFYMINLLTKLSQQPKAPKSLTIANDVCRKKVLWLECNADLTRLQIMQETYMQNIEIEVQELNRKIAKIKDYSIIEMLVTNDTLSIKPFAQRAATGDAKYMPGEEWFTNMLQLPNYMALLDQHAVADTYTQLVCGSAVIAAPAATSNQSSLLQRAKAFFNLS